jgi:phage terminase small subunit
MKLQPTPGAPAAPKHLESPERKLWTELTEQFAFADAASVAMLQVALESHMRARRCREKIDADGEAIQDRFGQTKPHPLLAAERDARAAFLSAMRTLNLDLAGESK